MNRPSVGKNAYFTVNDENTDNLSINNGLWTISPSHTEISLD